jgi:hypothetical protein
MSGRREVLLTDERWEKVRRFIPKVKHPKGVAPELKIEAALKASYGFSKVALAGKIYQKDFPSPARAGGISRVGRGGSIPRNVACFHI